MDQQILISGITYVQLGLPIIPFCSWNHEGIKPNSMHATKICKCKGKVPLIKWRDHEETTLQDITDWKNEFQAYNIGMAMGGKTGYIGIDIDGAEGETILAELQQGRKLPETWEFTSGAGRRLIYAIPKGLETKKSVNTGKGVHTECSILADGQVTVLPPSIHHTGKRYQWVAGKSPMESDCAMAPQWLIDLVRADKPIKEKRAEKKIDEFTINLEQKGKTHLADMSAAFCCEEFSAEMPDTVAQAKAKNVKSKKKEETTKSWMQMMQETVSEGGRNNAMTKFIGSLLSEEFIRRTGKDSALMYIRSYNEKCLDPPLNEEEYLPQLEAFWEQESMKDAEYKKSGKKQKIAWIVPDMVESLKSKLNELGLTYVFDIGQKSAYYCKDNIGPWIEDLDCSRLRQIFYDLVQSDAWGMPEWARPSYAEEIIKVLKDNATVTQLRSQNIFVEDGTRSDLDQYLPVDGKLLDWRTGEIKPWNIDFLTLANFEIGYDPEAKCPYWEKYMEEWLPDENARNFLQEFLGEALLPKPDADGKFVILVGGGANGKSMCMNAIEDIFGNTCTSQELGRLQARFGASKLYGKRLNICSEIEDGSGYLSAPGVIKRLVTGETMDIEFKGKDCFDYRPIASHIFSCNTLPRVKDKSQGWYRRQVVIPFVRTFEARADVAYEMNRHIKEERAGIFNWLLEGLRRKSKRGYYKISDSMNKVQEKVREEQDNLLQFLRLFVAFPKSNVVTKQEAVGIFKQKYGVQKHGINVNLLYNLYVMWYHTFVSDKSQAVISNKGFKVYLENHFKVISKGQCFCVTRSTQSTCFLGIDFTYTTEMIDTFLEMMENDSLLYSKATSVIDGLTALKHYCMDTQKMIKISLA